MGYGHRLRAHDAFRYPISAAMSESLLMEDAHEACDFVAGLVPSGLSGPALIAATSVVMSAGARRFAQSRLPALLDSGSMEQAANEILTWCKVQGQVVPEIQHRRHIEAALLLS